LAALAAADKASALAVWDEAMLCAKGIQEAEDQQQAVGSLVQAVGSVPPDARGPRLLELLALATAIPSAHKEWRAVCTILAAQSVPEGERRSLVGRALAFVEGLGGNLEGVWVLKELIGLAGPEARMGIFRQGTLQLSGEWRDETFRRVPLRGLL